MQPKKINKHQLRRVNQALREIGLLGPGGRQPVTREHMNLIIESSEKSDQSVQGPQPHPSDHKSRAS